MSFLRPDFTKRFWQTLKQQRAVNLYGAPYSGRARLLEDMKGLAQPNKYLFISIDIKQWIPLSYQSFLNDFMTQLDIDKDFSDSSFKGLVQFGLAQLPPRKIIVVFRHFDRLLDNHLHQFPNAFFHDLNSLKNGHNRFLYCCITEKPHNLSVFKAVDEPESKTSWLDLSTAIDLAFQRLQLSEIRAEMERMKYDKADKEFIADYIHKDAAPMQLFLALQNTMHGDWLFEKHIQQLEHFRKTKFGKTSFLTQIFGWMAWKN